MSGFRKESTEWKMKADGEEEKRRAGGKRNEGLLTARCPRACLGSRNGNNNMEGNLKFLGRDIPADRLTWMVPRLDADFRHSSRQSRTSIPNIHPVAIPTAKG